MTGVDHVKVYRDLAGEWRWTASAANNEPVASSGEGYKHQGHAERMARDMFPHASVLISTEPDPED